MNNMSSGGKFKRLTTKKQEAEFLKNHRKAKPLPTLNIEKTIASSERRTTWYTDQLHEDFKRLDTTNGAAKRSSDNLDLLKATKESNLLRESKFSSTRRSAPQLDRLNIDASSDIEARQSCETSSSSNALALTKVRLRNKQSNSPVQWRNKTVSTYEPIGNSGSSPGRKLRPFSVVLKPSNMKRPQGSVNSEKASLSVMLGDKKLRSAFEQFLKSEYSSENLSFWCCCERYKKLKTTEQRYREGEQIFEEYISPRSPNQINIDGMTQRQITLQVTGGDSLPCDIFDTAQKKVFSIMENDSFPRFLRSSFYKDVATRRRPLESLLGTFLSSKNSSDSSRTSPTNESSRFSNSRNNNNNNNLRSSDSLLIRMSSPRKNGSTNSKKSPQYSADEVSKVVRALCEPTKVH